MVSNMWVAVQKWTMGLSCVGPEHLGQQMINATNIQSNALILRDHKPKKVSFHSGQEYKITNEYLHEWHRQKQLVMVIKYIYLSSVLRYNVEVFVLYTIISMLYFLLLCIRTWFFFFPLPLIISPALTFICWPFGGAPLLGWEPLD